MSDWPPPDDGKPLLTRDDYPETWDSSAYLSAFYSRADNEPAMKLVLSQLPSIAERLSRLLSSVITDDDNDEGGRLLDVGSGPTIHVACAFREKMFAIYLSDYLPQNREELCRWKKNGGRFDWSEVIKFLTLMEGQPLPSAQERLRIEEVARSKVAAVLPCDIFHPNVIPAAKNVPGDFDVITTFFCIEYAAVDEKEYTEAVTNVCNLLKPGGFLVMGGVMNSTWCSFGSVKYTCFTLTEQVMLAALRTAGIDVGGADQPDSWRYFNYDDMFIVTGRKKHTPRQQTGG